MSMLDLSEHPHRRYNILTGDWILCSPHRAKRPWQGQVEDLNEDERPEYDQGCYLCPGNDRAGGKVTNPKYDETFAFVNDFSALNLDTPNETYNENDLLIARGEPGICRVICFSPKHNRTLPQMTDEEVRKVVDLWTNEYQELGKLPEVNYVQIFENKGEMMGCSNPHPHGQIWAENSLPVEQAKENQKMKEYYTKHGRSILTDYLELECKKKERIILENDSFVVLVPFWAVWPFETMIVSKEHKRSLLDLTEKEKNDLASIMRIILIKYDNMFNISFPYSGGIHQKPTDGKEHPEWHFHLHFYPPLLRSATIKKFMVGYELLGNPQRDITAEQAAERLRNLSTERYK